MPDHLIEPRCAKPEIRVFLLLKTHPNLPQAEQVEVIDQERGRQDGDPSNPEHDHQDRPNDRALEVPHLGWKGSPLPEEQEQQQLAEQQANKPPQEDPALREARGVELSGEADFMNAQTKQQVEQFNAQVKMEQVSLEKDKIALARETLQLDAAKFERAGQDKFNVEAAKIDQGQQALDLKAQQQQIDNGLKIQAAQQQQINDAIANLKTIQDASGDATIIGPGLVDNMKTQSDIVSEEQSKQ